MDYPTPLVPGFTDASVRQYYQSPLGCRGVLLDACMISIRNDLQKVSWNAKRQRSRDAVSPNLKNLKYRDVVSPVIGAMG